MIVSMTPRTLSRTASSIGSNQSSKSMAPAATAAVFVVFFVMAWSPFRRSNAGISWVEHPGDYANRISTTPATAPHVRVHHTHRAGHRCAENGGGSAVRAGQAGALRPSPPHGDGAVDPLARPPARKRAICSQCLLLPAEGLVGSHRDRSDPSVAHDNSSRGRHP